MKRRAWLGKITYGSLLPVVTLFRESALAENGGAVTSISDDLSMPVTAPLSDAEQQARDAERLAKKASLQKKVGC